jgi:hypothetical protein
VQFENITDCLVYLSLKQNFKYLLFSPDNQFISKNLFRVFATDKKHSIKSSLVFMILNIVRDCNFDMIPSYTYSKKELLKQADLSYYELKELK